MKKKSRFLTGLLSAVMALSLCALPASAEGNKVLTIPDWENKKGSITINKYDYDTTTGDGTRDDGEKAATGDKAKNPMDGVSFTIYKVENKEWLEKYYTGTNADNTKQPQVENYYKDGKLVKKVLDADQHTDTTANGGKLVFRDLELGLYLVVETGKPDYVTKAVSPFLVSVPMTSVDKTSWLYDIIVNPKNSATYGKAILQKQGVQASNTIKEMEGYTFDLYKWSNNNWVKIEYPPKNSVDNADTDHPYNLTTDANGQIVVDNLTKGVYCFIETGVNANSGYILDADTAYEFSIDDKGAMVIVPEADRKNQGPNNTTVVYNAVDNATLTVVNYKPDFNKCTTKKDGTVSDKEKNDADYSVGEKIPYTLTIDVPENIAKLNTFKVTDTEDKNQLLHDVSSVKISGQEDESNTYWAANVDYTIAPITGDVNNDGFVIDFKAGTNKKIDSYAGKKVTITYYATLQTNAVIAGQGNLNTAALEYSNKTNVTGDNDKPNKIVDKAVIYTFRTGIKKTDENGNKLPENVYFDLYKDVTDVKNQEYGTARIITGDVAKKIGLDDTKKWYKVNADEVHTDEKGELTFEGLSNGTYKLVETKTAKGYNLLSAPVDVTLTVNYVTTWQGETVYNSNGELIKRTEHTAKYDNQDKYTFTQIKVINRKGFDLPVTGGFGTLLFSAIGALLVVGGVGVLMSTKKKKGNG